MRAIEEIRFSEPLAPFDEAAAEFNRAYVQAALIACRGNLLRAAERAGVLRNTLSRRCEQSGIPKGFGRKRKRP